MSIFNFNHIDKNKTKEEIQEIKELYKYYHYRHWCYQKAYKYFKKIHLAINMASTGLMVYRDCCRCIDGQSSDDWKHIWCWFGTKDFP